MYSNKARLVGRIIVKQIVSATRGAGATGAEGAAAPVAQTVRGQHGGSKLPFLIKIYICYSYRQLN